MEFVPSRVVDSPSYCNECYSKIEMTLRYHDAIGKCQLCSLKPVDQCYCDYRYDSILYSCPSCRYFCQRCGGDKDFYFNSRKQRGSGLTRDWINAFNRNKPFTRFVSGLSHDLKHAYYPQDLCDNCINTLLGWAWKNIKPNNPYWDSKIFVFDNPTDDSQMMISSMMTFCYVAR